MRDPDYSELPDDGFCKQCFKCRFRIDFFVTFRQITAGKHLFIVIYGDENFTRMVYYLIYKKILVKRLNYYRNLQKYVKKGGVFNTFFK